MKQCISLLAILVLTGCAVLTEDSYISRGQPESLLDISAERVSFGVGTAKTLDELTAWINDDQPDRAEIACDTATPACAEAQELLESFSIPVKASESSNNNSVVLVYERVVARDCENSFVSNHHNARNLNHPAFGCSNAVNQLQMVGDRRQFFDPVLSDFQDAASVNGHIAKHLGK